jgi:hypothetical protein
MFNLGYYFQMNATFNYNKIIKYYNLAIETQHIIWDIIMKKVYIINV